jgi:hypothetical protein
MITTPRCGQPVEERRISRPRDFTEAFPVCWRPAGHRRGSQHLSRETYLHYLDVHRLHQAARRARLKMSEAQGKMKP